MGHSFATFCHISEYGPSGYEALHRMLAMSEPLLLWAPSSRLLSTPTCRISPEQFLRHVEEGRIRVAGRAEWLLDPVYRDKHPWDGARWDPIFDRHLARICEADQAVPEADRRVLLAPPETGQEQAQRYLEANPDQVGRWSAMVDRADAALLLPVGTLQSALRQPTPAARATAVLRDAFNHGAALAGSGADAPVFLSATDEQFMRLLAASPTAPGTPAAPAAWSTPVTAELGSLVGQLVRFLRFLDEYVAGRRNSDTVRDFVTGPGHQELVGWLSGLCTLARSSGERFGPDTVVDQLLTELRAARFTGITEELRRDKVGSLVGLAGLLMDVAGFVGDADLMGVIGVGLSVYPVGRGLAKAAGFAPQGYDGPQWPFAYADRTQVSRRAHRTMLRYVEAAAQHRPG